MKKEMIGQDRTEWKMTGWSVLLLCQISSMCTDVTDDNFTTKIVKFDLILYDNFVTYNTCLKRVKLDEK